MFNAFNETDKATKALKFKTPAAAIMDHWDESTAETTSMAMTSSSGGDAAAVDLETEAFHKCIASAVDLSDAHVDETNGYLSGKDEDAVCLVVAVDWF